MSQPKPPPRIRLAGRQLPTSVPFARNGAWQPTGPGSFGHGRTQPARLGESSYGWLKLSPLTGRSGADGECHLLSDMLQAGAGGECHLLSDML